MLKSIDPSNGNLLKEFKELNKKNIDIQIDKSFSEYLSWKNSIFSDRSKLIRKVAKILRDNKKEYSQLMTSEMGKPISQSELEIDKCIQVCEYYSENGGEILKNKRIETDATDSYINFSPLGVILGVMPWNFPFWQVFRFAIPCLMAGNVVLLKHSSNVPQCAIEIEKIFIKAGFPKDAFKSLLIGSRFVNYILKNDKISAVSLTGSSYAGSKVAGLAGSYIKKAVLELGGSDPFIVLNDANLDYTIKEAVKARVINNGQSCIAAKRFIIEESIYDEFKNKFTKNIEKLKLGNPLDRSTDIGPLATKEIVDILEDQVNKSIKKGAIIETGGRKSDNTTGFYYMPTVLSNVKKGMPVYDEETFGPVATLIKVKDEKEAIKTANDTSYGLGASIWTMNTKKGEEISEQIEAGNVFINEIVKSDTRLPFGGIKKSGFGRELSQYGIKEFVNIKTIYVKEI